MVSEKTRTLKGKSISNRFETPVLRVLWVLEGLSTKFSGTWTKDIFVGYNETSKAYRIFIPTHWRTMVSQDVKFKEEFASKKSHETLLVTEDEEREAPKVETSSSFFRRRKWFMQTLEDAQEHVEAPRSTFRESGPLKKFPKFMALMSNIIEEAVDEQVY
jgi:hypothetical protein